MPFVSSVNQIVRHCLAGSLAIVSVCLCTSRVYGQQTSPTTTLPQPTTSLTLFGTDGKPRICLDASGPVPVIQLLESNGSVALELKLDSTDHPIIHLQDSHNTVSSTLQIDPKGTHLMMNGPGKSRTYVFLTDADVSGMVMQDKAGMRRFDVIRGADGKVSSHRYSASGKPLAGYGTYVAPPGR